MNYSQRKYLERLMAQEPSEKSDPLGIWPSSLRGLQVVESPNLPRYTLPPEIIPGVEWPAGFREAINSWSVAFLGTTNRVPRGSAYMIGERIVVMRPEDVVRVSNISI